MNRFLVPVVAAVMLASPAMATSLLVNGSFEDTPVANGDVFDSLAEAGGLSWAVFDTLPGWTAVPSIPGIEVQTDETLGNIDAQDGEHYVELDSTANATIRQTVELDRGTYELSFWYSPRMSNPETNGMTYSIAGLFGELTGPGTNPVTAVGTWTQIVVRFFVEEDGVYNLDFAANTRDDSLGALVDNAALAAVPVPAAGGLLLLGLGGLAAMRRRKAA